jgi:hypothetical protein
VIFSFIYNIHRPTEQGTDTNVLLCAQAKLKAHSSMKCHHSSINPGGDSNQRSSVPEAKTLPLCTPRRLLFPGRNPKAEPRRRQQGQVLVAQRQRPERASAAGSQESGQGQLQLQGRKRDPNPRPRSHQSTGLPRRQM